MSKPFVIVSHELPQHWISSLYEACDVLVGPPTTVESGLSAEVTAALPRATGLLTMLTVKVDDSLLAAAPNLRVVSQMAVGVDNIDLAACRARGIPVGNTPGIVVPATANIAMALLLSAARGLPHASSEARAGRWGTWSPTGFLGQELTGATLGIVGMGQIGRATARRARAFGMNIVYTSRRRYPVVEAELNAQRLPLEALLATSDFVSLHTALTPETHQLINATTLAQMKRSAILVNTARGGVVDTEALYAALQQGTIAAAALDVTDPEPLPASHPLYQLPNCFITPHIGTSTENTRRQMAEMACENLLAGLKRTSLPWRVA